MNMTVSADTLSVTCSGWTANDQTCTFEVRTLTQDCGFTSDTSTSSVTLSSELYVYSSNIQCHSLCTLFLWFCLFSVNVYTAYTSHC